MEAKARRSREHAIYPPTLLKSNRVFVRLPCSQKPVRFPVAQNESLKKLKENAMQREEINKWQPRELIVGKDIPFVPTIRDYTDYQYVIPVIETFNAWKTKNYGALSIYLNRLFSYEKSEKKRAGECRQMFSSKEFCSFELKEVEERACSMSRILVQADWAVGGKHFSEPLEFGCVYQDGNENPVLPWRGTGKWMLIPWNVQGLYKI